MKLKTWGRNKQQRGKLFCPNYKRCIIRRRFNTNTPLDCLYPTLACKDCPLKKELKV